ncbi:hypothetical protein CKY02_00735 [Photorhabdus bodei]|uniref:Uncharacterized protein n=1 Tax=Photorhabdus bodei TaxID=2029681 RepID=A0A329XJP9_9GAMM|nr:hypothetical protein CKY02_00735 [Photorhabdus bodei]
MLYNSLPAWKKGALIIKLTYPLILSVIKLINNYNFKQYNGGLKFIIWGHHFIKFYLNFHSCQTLRLN